MQHLARQIHQHIMKAKKVVIIPHQNPDGDAIGAATAFHEYLESLQKDNAIFCVTPVNHKLHFVPHSQGVVVHEEIFADPLVDTIVVLDSGDLRYAGVDKFLKNHPAIIINIDHHATNEQYGHINMVFPTASSTSELVYQFLRHNHIVINQRMATSLLTGLMTDTGNFTNAATSVSAMEAASELVRAGGNLTMVNTGTVKNKSVNTLHLWGAVLSRLTTHEPLGITYTYLTQKDLAEHGVEDAESEGIANFLNNLEGVKISLILKETPGGTVKGSFRTTRDDVDVSAMAKALGGGGHKKAAGFNCAGTIESVLQKIFTTT